LSKVLKAGVKTPKLLISAKVFSCKKGGQV